MGGRSFGLAHGGGLLSDRENRYFTGSSTVAGKNGCRSRSSSSDPVESQAALGGERTMETIKTASFEYLVDLAKEKDEGGYLFTLDGSDYHINDVLEISKIAERHGYIVIY